MERVSRPAIDRFLWIVMLLGLVLRLAVLMLLPVQEGLTDAETYLAAARDILAGRVFASELVMPLYPLQAALVGAHPLALKLTDVLLSTLSIWLVHGIAWSMFRTEAAARLAALGAAVYPHFLFYPATGLTETSYTFLVLLGFHLAYAGRLTAGACALVLSILSRPSLEPLLPLLLIVFAAVVHRLPRAQVGKLLARTAVIYLAVMAPWWLHNYAKYDQFVRLNLGDGRMLYMGNNPLNRSGGGIEGVDADMTRFYDGIADPIARNDAMKAEALAFIRDNPGRFVELAGLRFLRFWRLWPHAPGYQSWHVVVASLASYGVALALALAFLIRHGRTHWRVLAPIVLFAAFLTAVHAVTLGSVRYRFPLEPFVLILAAAMAARGLRCWRARTSRNPLP